MRKVTSKGNVDSQRSGLLIDTALAHEAMASKMNVRTVIDIDYGIRFDV